MAWVAKRLRGAKVWVECDPSGQPLGGEDQRVDVLYRQGGKRYRAALRNLLPDEDTAVRSDAEMSPAEPAASPAAAASSASSAAPVNSATHATAAHATAASTAAHPTAAHGTTASAAAHATTARGPGESTGAAGASPGPLFAGQPPSPPQAARKPAAQPHAGRHQAALHVYTDGACTGNPGPMGLGVVVLDLSGEPARRELSEYLGVGTNNIAELTAILRGLQVLPRDRQVVVYSDSSYAIGLLSQNWKAKANQELVAALRQLLREFPAVHFVKVAGHAGVPENERCDELARAAITGARR